MSNENIYNMWFKFMQTYGAYILNKDKWKDKFQQLKNYIEKNNCMPSTSHKNKNIRSLRIWFIDQKDNYTNKQYIMSDPEIYNLFNNFLHDEKYSKYLISNEQRWKQKWLCDFKKLKDYCNNFNERPSKDDKNKEHKRLGVWMCTQNINYKKKIKMMIDQEIYNLWKIFSEKYNDFFISDKDKWKKNMESAKKYIVENKKPPSAANKDTKIKYLGHWFTMQKINYKNRRQIMQDDEIRKIWSEFIDEYKEYIK